MLQVRSSEQLSSDRAQKLWFRHLCGCVVGGEIAASAEHMNDPDKPPVVIDGCVVLVDYSENKASTEAPG